MVAWAAASLLLPTVMRTKVSWYLNPFYPLFAVGVAVVLVHAFSRARDRPRASLRLGALAAIVVVAVVAAEARLAWNSVRRRALVHSEQSLLLGARDELGGRRVFHDRRNHATYFVGAGLVGATLVEAVDPTTFLRDSAPGDYYLTSQAVADARLVVMRSTRRHWLYRRRE